MRIAVTSYGMGPDSPVDSRFHAATYLLLYDTEKESWDSCEFRQEKRRPKDQGREKVRQILETVADILISAGIDPASFKQLARNGVKIYGAPKAPARDAVSLYISGGLDAMYAPDAVNVAILAKRGISRKL